MPGLISALMAIRSQGIIGTFKILRYTRRRDRLDQDYAAQRPPAGPPVSPGRLLKTTARPSGARFEFERAALEVHFLAPDLARLTWEPGELPQPYAIHTPDWAAVETRLAESPAGNQLTSPGLQIQVGLDGSLEFCTPDGRSLRREDPPLHQGEPRPQWTHTARLAPGERLYGLGEQAGRLDLRGGSHRMWNSDPAGSYGPGTDPLYMPLPLYLGQHAQGSYLVFYENYHAATFHLGVGEPHSADAPATAHFEGGALRSYFIAGPLPQAIERFTELTGRAGLPPLWSLGYHQCRWGYKTAADIRAVAAGFREHRMPLSAIHLDIDYMDGFRVFSVDPQRFPDLPGLAAEMAAQGIRLVTIVDPGVKQDHGYALYRDGLQRDAFCKLPDGSPVVGQVWPQETVFPDFTDPPVREWWGEQYARLLGAGVAGIWHDMNEPASFAAWGSMTLPLATRHAMDGQGGDHTAGHNVYGLQMNRAAHTALRRQRPERRPWIISRAGWVSQQRYAWNWTGDTESSWAALRMTIPTVLGLGLSGQPFSGPDIGGFSGNPSAELYLRSFQMAAFLPFFRTHSAIGTAPREPWVFGEPYTAILRQFIELRYSLLPYLYTLAWQASQTGHPPVRPLFWAEPENPDLWDSDDAFLLGDALLVAPILEPETSERSLLLPGGDWYNYWDGTLLAGGREVRLAAGLERIPLLVQAGSVLPTQEGERLALHLWAPTPGSPLQLQVLYSDAGEGYGPHRVDQFHLQHDATGLGLAWESRGDYPFPYPEIAVHVHGLAPGRVWVDGVEQAGSEIRVTQPFERLRIERKP